MADPNTISNIIDVVVTLSTGGGSSVQSFSDPVFVSEFAASVSFPDRVKAYVGTSAEKKAQLVADGFATTSAAYLQVSAANAQGSPPRTIYIGRADATDLTWEDTLTAIWAQADADGFSLFALAVDTRDEAAQEEIADWVHERGFVLFGAQTASTAVLTNAPGNVARNIRTKGYDSTWILWHDPETASNYGPATLTGRTGPFSLGAGGTIKVRMDGGAEQTFTLAGAAATMLGSNTETFALADGDDMELTIDGGDAQTATVSLTPAELPTSNVEPFNFASSPKTLSLRVDGGAAQPISFAGTAGEQTGSNTEPFVPVAATQLHVQVDGGATQAFIFAGTETTAQLVADLINATAAGFVAEDDGGAVKLTSSTLGSASEIEIMNTSTAGLLTVLGFVAGSDLGTGFAANLAAATAAEVAAEINTDTTGVIASDDDGAVLLTSDTDGTSSRLQITGGTANAILSFPTNETSGTGDFPDGSAVTAAQMVTWLAALLYGVTVAVDTAAVRLTSRSLGTASEIAIVGGTLATELGLTGSDAGSGDYAIGSAVTAAEVATKISATITDGTAGDVSSAVVLYSDTEGSESTVEVSGGTLASKLFSALTATGTGVLEDYAECAWFGSRITLPLDSPNGQGNWTKAQLTGIFPDKLTAAQKQLLHLTQKVNTYTSELGVAETGFGTVCYGTTNAQFRYIDQIVSAAWLDARMTERLNNALNALAQRRVKAPYTDGGISILATEFRAVLQAAATNGHTILDTSPIENENDRGITIPTIAQQNATDIALRKVSGFAARQQLQDAINRAAATINLVVAQAA
jgi:hypothetical protein